ncbi:MULTISPECIES: hypothetical protein [Yersinia pseudotuberculosis complex]|nr:MULTISPECIES: hypothetical protein [Yersinia pseudotuberculosis complex]MCE4114039.1 hypothetical protein [Yersinia pseudotuberculosis]MCF1164284.1 hypothetical protein [Yersinia pseudotuberculosis]UFA63392.1 Uncharacterized protein YP598_3778 [Yersinia pseudotuberculosis]WLF03511.1 hypothetical protein Q6G25_18390 [Yersinia pseudotuberculosis]CFV32407.1 Uncharacterised protein [Yersinia pseudotuberculosis]
MTKRIVWKENDLVSIKLRDDLYTIAQMLNRPEMRFYDISSSNGIWKNINLNEVNSLFRVFVASRVVLPNLVAEKIKDDTVIPKITPYERYWIKSYTLTMDREHYQGDRFSFPFLGGKIIDLGPDGNVSVTQAPIIKEDLALPQDRELIEKYELTNMWGHEDLSDRLCRYFDTGINRDDLKFEVFPGLWDDREKLRPLTRRLPVPLR